MATLDKIHNNVKYYCFNTPKYGKIRAVGIIFFRGEVGKRQLLFARKRETKNLVPLGGKVDQGDTNMYNTLFRELREEVNIPIFPSSFVNHFQNEDSENHISIYSLPEEKYLVFLMKESQEVKDLLSVFKPNEEIDQLEWHDCNLDIFVKQLGAVIKNILPFLFRPDSLLWEDRKDNNRDEISSSFKNLSLNRNS